MIFAPLDIPAIPNKENIIQKCGWSPLENKPMRSSIYATILNGDIAFKDGQFSDSLKFGHRLEFDN